MVNTGSSYANANSPLLSDNSNRMPHQLGEMLFFSNKTNCYVCHPKPLFTDMKMYDVKTHAEKDYTTIAKGKRVAQKLFDTPSLVELWRTAPYMHDGRYMTINDVVTKGEENSAHNGSSQLSLKEIEDLVSYLLSI